MTALLRSKPWKPDPRRAGMSVARMAVVAALSAVACLGAPVAASAAPAGTSNVSPRIICGRDVGMEAGTGFVRDDWWDERVCIAVTPQVAGFTVTTRVTPRAAGVVAYPYVLAAGWAWGVHAPRTSLPERMSDSGDPRLTFRTRGNPAGVYNRSADLWFDPEPLHTGHGSAEVMVWLTARGYQHSKIYTHPIARVPPQRLQLGSRLLGEQAPAVPARWMSPVQVAVDHLCPNPRQVPEPGHQPAAAAVRRPAPSPPDSCPHPTTG